MLRRLKCVACVVMFTRLARLKNKEVIVSLCGGAAAEDRYG